MAPSRAARLATTFAVATASVLALLAAPASATAAKPVPAKADYTVVLAKPGGADCGLTTLDGGALAIRAGKATLVTPGGPKLTGWIHRKGGTFSIRVAAKKSGITTVALLSGKLNAQHLLVGKSELGGAFPGGSGYACNYAFTGELLPPARTACPSSAALFAAWRAQKPPPGPGVTGFGPVTCWRTFAVAHVLGQADGSAAFTRVPKLHLNNASEGAAFHQQVCHTATAPKRWKTPDVAGCF